MTVTELLRRRWVRVLGLVLLLLVGGAVTAFALVWRPAIAPVEAPRPGEGDAALVERGAQLAALGNCVACHTAPGGAPYAGGRALPTPFGTVWSRNITPDRDTGIGTWSEAAFRRAMHDGVDRAGHHLYPVFPYDHLTNVTDDDVRALYVFLRSREPVRATPPANQLPFPLNHRPLLAGWKLLFLRTGRFQPDPAHDAEWNRGAYLVQGLAHCGACHTPRNSLGAEKRGEALAGGEAEGWDAPPLLAARSWAPAPWTAEELFNYLRHGMDKRHSAAAGPMNEVVHALARAPEDDVRAIAAYVSSVLTPAGAASTAPPQLAQRPWPEAAAPAASGLPMSGSPASGSGAAIFGGACAICHANDTPTAQAGYPSLLLSTALNAPSPRNAVRAVLAGVEARNENTGPLMPAYAAMLTDAQVADVLRFLRAGVPGRAPWPDLDAAVRDARKGAAP